MGEGLCKELVVLAEVAAVAVIACIVVLLLLGPPRPYSLVKCYGDPEECRLLAEQEREVFAQMVEVAFLGVAVVTVVTAIAAAMRDFYEKKKRFQSRVVKSLPETM